MLAELLAQLAPPETLPPGCSVTLLCPPTRPSTPFGTPLVAVYDALRVVCVLGGLYVIARCTLVARLVNAPRQRGVYIALAIGALVTLGTELDHLGDYAHYRLLLHVAFTAVGCWSLRGIRGRVQDWGASTGTHSVPQSRRTS